jgi:hypothetical protein
LGVVFYKVKKGGALPSHPQLDVRLKQMAGFDGAKMAAVTQLNEQEELGRGTMLAAALELGTLRDDDQVRLVRTRRIVTRELEGDQSGFAVLGTVGSHVELAGEQDAADRIAELGDLIITGAIGDRILSLDVPNLGRFVAHDRGNGTWFLERERVGVVDFGFQDALTLLGGDGHGHRHILEVWAEPSDARVPPVLWRHAESKAVVSVE